MYIYIYIYIYLILFILQKIFKCNFKYYKFINNFFAQFKKNIFYSNVLYMILLHRNIIQTLIIIKRYNNIIVYF